MAGLGDEYSIKKMMNFAFKMIEFVLKMVNFGLTMTDYGASDGLGDDREMARGSAIDATSIIMVIPLGQGRQGSQRWRTT